MEQEKVVCILSGGLDSTTLLYELIADGKKVYALSVDYGQRHFKELVCASDICSLINIPHKIARVNIGGILGGNSLTDSSIDVPEGHYEADSMKDTVVPNRNMILISLAVAYAESIGATMVAYAAHAGDHAIYPDCRREFTQPLQEAIYAGNYGNVKLFAPYLRISKGTIVSLGRALGVPFSKTWSCYKGDTLPCGKCGTCVERLEAFAAAGSIDPLRYA